MLRQVDVVIVGGGPAGISTALALRAYSDLSVAIVEKSDFGDVRVGEHVSAGILELLDYLKISREDFGEECFTPSYGTTSFWGSEFPVDRDAIFTSEESSFQLDREDFDLTLVEKFLEREGHVLPRTRMVACSQGSGGDWELSLVHAEKGPSVLKSRFLVDATGRRSVVVRQLGVPVRKVDQLVGVGSVFEPPPGEAIEKRLTIESVADGWWYLASLRGGLIAAVYFSDADLVSRGQINRNGYWLEALAGTRRSRELLSGSRATRKEPWVRNAFSAISDFSSQRGTLAVGEAACSFDPISSMGIGFAMSSGCHAARVIRAYLESSSRGGLETYQSDLERHFEDYLLRKNQIYGQENRWRESIFWSRRK